MKARKKQKLAPKEFTIPKPINRDRCQDQIQRLSDMLRNLDKDGFNFLEMSELTPMRRMQLNVAIRALKRSIIFSQTDLWEKLTESDRAQIVEQQKIWETALE